MIKIYTIEETKILRKYISLSVEELYHLIDMTRQSGYNIENGKVERSKAIGIALTTVLNFLYSELDLNPQEVIDDFNSITNETIKKLILKPFYKGF